MSKVLFSEKLWGATCSLTKPRAATAESLRGSPLTATVRQPGGRPMLKAGGEHVALDLGDVCDCLEGWS
jgi:hypothetical protein